ncbi:MFS transporter [Marinobacter sp. M1N3S26]|uniref:MFS transporter n=1 Tax=unclassified Marinobacter TaxID=83889 RepID=UPI00387B754A
MTIRGREAWGPVLMMGVLQSAMVAALPWLIERTGLSAGLWSMILSAGMIPVLLGAPLWGQLVDRRGAQRVSLIASAMVLAGFGLFLLALGAGLQGAIGLGCLLVARLAHGIGAGGVFPAAQRLAVADADPGEWSYRLSRLQMSVHAGRLAGPTLIALAVWLGMMTVLTLTGVLALLLVSGLRWQRGQQPEGEFAAGGDSGGDRRPPWRAGWPYYLMALVLTVAVGAVQFVLGPRLTALAGVSAEVGASLTAAALILASLIGLVFGPLVHSRVRGSPILGAIWGSSLLVGGTLLAYAQNLSAMFGGIAALAFGAAVLTPWYGSLLRQCHPDAQGEVAGRLTSTHTLGYIIGTLAGGWLLETSPGQPLLALLLIAPALVMLAWRAGGFTRRDRKVG